MRERHTRSEKKERKEKKREARLNDRSRSTFISRKETGKKGVSGGQAPCEWAIKHEGEDGAAKCQEEARRGC